MRSNLIPLVVLLVSLPAVAGCLWSDGGPEDRRENYALSDCLSQDLRPALAPPTTGSRSDGNLSLQRAFRALDDVRSLDRLSVGITLYNRTGNRVEGTACLAGETKVQTFLMAMKLSPTLMNASNPLGGAGGMGGMGGGAAPWQSQDTEFLLAGKRDGTLLYVPALDRAMASYTAPSAAQDRDEPEPFWGNRGPGAWLPVLAPARELGDYRNFTITGSEPVTHNGKPATKVGFTYSSREGTLRGAAVLYDNPDRPAAIGYEFDHPEPRPGQPSMHPVQRGYGLMVFRYNEDVTLTLGEPLQRAMALAMPSSFGGGFNSGSDSRTTRTLTYSPLNGTTPIPLSEVEFRMAKDQGSGGQKRAYVEEDYVLRLPLAQRTVTAGNFTATFTDRDNDGFVSRNDTVEVRYTGAPRPNDPSWSPFEEYDLGTFDTKTRMFVTPGAGLWALLGALTGVAALAAATRRRG